MTDVVYPCRQKPQAEWCDHAGPGGFMGHTCHLTNEELMKPLFAKAEAEGLWFQSNYQGIWFSPKDLRQQQASGKFRWGPVNWQLLPYTTYLREEKLPELELMVKRWAEIGGHAIFADLMDAITRLKAKLEAGS